MVLDVVRYGHPVLRQKGARLERITDEVRELIADMMDTMYAARGVGLAAQQVGRALQLTVIDVTGVTDRPSTLELNGKPVDVEEHMPMVLVNPEAFPVAEPVSGPEGCLSFPEVFAEITRPEAVEVKAMDPEGNQVQFRCGGLLARAIQHEIDHLNGILFIDRMDPAQRRELKPELDAIATSTKESLKKRR